MHHQFIILMIRTILLACGGDNAAVKILLAVIISVWYVILRGWRSNTKHARFVCAMIGLGGDTMQELSAFEEFLRQQNIVPERRISLLRVLGA